MRPQDVASACECHTEDLMAKANVVGVGDGGDRVVVLVERKVSANELHPRDLVPSSVVASGGASVRTDVVEVGELKALHGEEFLSQGHVDGLKPGASIGARGGGTGTCGCLVVKGGETCILSNNHVLAGVNRLPLDTVIVHPGGADSSSGGEVARLSEFVPIDVSTSASNRYDCAIARVTRPEAIVGNGDIVSPVAPPPAVGTKVLKTGRTTGRTEGKVIATNVTVQVNMGSPGTARFVGQVVTGDMSNPGDSGSVAHLEDGRPCLLLFAGSSSATIFNPLDGVMDAMGVTLYGEPEPDPEPDPEPEPEPEPECTEITIKIKVCGKAQITVEQ